MKLSQKTIQSHIDFFISGDFTWVDVDYRGDNWELTVEEYPEDNAANFYFTDGNRLFSIHTHPVFEGDKLKSAKVADIHYLGEETE